MTENVEKSSSSSSSVSPAIQEILSSILPQIDSECEIKSKDIPSTSSDNEEQPKEPNIVNNRPGPSCSLTSNSFPNISHRNDRELQVYRAVGCGLVNSTSVLHNEALIENNQKSTNRIPPSYSSVIKLGPQKPLEDDFMPSLSFVARQPPPSYSEVQGIWQDSPSIISSDSRIFGPEPAYVICPRCRTVVVTDVERERSMWTYFASMLMCLMCCWPCCLLPYWTDAFQYTYHTCPNCRHYFGMYRPC